MILRWINAHFVDWVPYMSSISMSSNKMYSDQAPVLVGFCLPCPHSWYRMLCTVSEALESLSHQRQNLLALKEWIAAPSSGISKFCAKASFDVLLYFDTYESDLVCYLSCLLLESGGSGCCLTRGLV
jgi:hypothetical protein